MLDKNKSHISSEIEQTHIPSEKTARKIDPKKEHNSGRQVTEPAVRMLSKRQV